MKAVSYYVLCLALALAVGPSACKGEGAAPTTRQADENAAAAPATAAPAQADAPPTPPAGTPMQIRLNSTPPGATAFVNGKAIGATPISHTVYVTGAPVEFTFTLEGYQPATYSFVPQVAGEVHGRMVPITLTPPPSAPAP